MPTMDREEAGVPAKQIALKIVKICIFSHLDASQPCCPTSSQAAQRQPAIPGVPFSLTFDHVN